MALGLGLVLVAASCRIHSTPPEHPISRSGFGASVRVETARDSWYSVVSGELLEARTDGLLLFVGGRVQFAPWGSFVSVTFPKGLGVERLEQEQPPEPAHLRRMQLVSRYAFGLDEDQLRRLLDSVGQLEPDPLGEGGDG